MAIPGGRSRPGESREEAAVRETRGEAGLDVVAVVRLGERVDPITGRQVPYTAREVVAGPRTWRTLTKSLRSRG